MAIRELDDALGLTNITSDYLLESRTGRNIQHYLVCRCFGSRLAGYEDTNDAECLAHDPAMRTIARWWDGDRPAASTNTMSRFEITYQSGS